MRSGQQSPLRKARIASEVHVPAVLNVIAQNPKPQFGAQRIAHRSLASVELSSVGLTKATALAAVEQTSTHALLSRNIRQNTGQSQFIGGDSAP